VSVCENCHIMKGTMPFRKGEREFCSLTCFEYYLQKQGAKAQERESRLALAHQMVSRSSRAFATALKGDSSERSREILDILKQAYMTKGHTYTN
jgi:hypothetical protein